MSTKSNDLELITCSTRLEEVLLSALGQSRIALDLESNGFYRYPERICLVQFAIDNAVYLVDPLAVEDLSELGALLAYRPVEKIFHAADYDIRSLHRDWNFRVAPLFDTSIAAAFTGRRNLGLAAVLKDVLKVEVEKTKRLQRADWTKRPITPELLTYAAGDVRHLAGLADVLRDQLASLGRVEWVEEESERLIDVRFMPSRNEWSFLSVKGSSTLDGRGLAILRSIHTFREQEAVRRDRPPFRIFSNAAMIALAENPRSDVRSVKGLGRYAFGRSGSALRKSLRDGIEAKPIERPKSESRARVRISERERKTARRRLSILKRWRSERAADLDIGVGLVWSAASLERLSLNPSSFEEELSSPDVRNWQRIELAESLSVQVKRL